jgi:PST family polysaccharide transporter
MVLARLAAPEVFGVFAAGSIFLGAGSILIESGMLAALVHRDDRLEEAAHTAFVATLIGGTLLSLAALGLSPVVGVVFSSVHVGAVAAALSGTLLLEGASVVPNALLQRRFSFLRRVVVDPIGVVLFGATAIAALAFGMGVWGLVLASYVSLAGQLVAAWRASRFRPQPRRFSFRLWRRGLWPPRPLRNLH